MRKGTFLLLAAGATALFALGCGGSGSGMEEVTASSISKPKFIEKVDAGCTRLEKKVQTDFGVYLKEIEKNGTKVVPADVVERIVIPDIDAELEEIRALGAPEGEVAKVKAIIKAVERTLKRREAEPESAMNERFWGYATPLAEKFGLKICGQH